MAYKILGPFSQGYHSEYFAVEKRQDGFVTMLVQQSPHKAQSFTAVEDVWRTEAMAVDAALQLGQKHDVPVYVSQYWFDKLSKTKPTHDLVSPWKPITNATHLKALGKLQEELGECTSAAARCVIQGLDGTEPETGKVNRVWLEEEIADVYANLESVIRRVGLDKEAIAVRAARKLKSQDRWHDEM